MGFFDNIGKTISDAGQATIKKGKDMADTAKYNGMISDEEKKISSLFEQMGRCYLENFGDSPAEPLKEYIDSIRESEAKIEGYRTTLKSIKGVTRCSGCGAEIPTGSMFCAVCGKKISSEDVSQSSEGIRCSACGALIPEGNKFCTSCGKPLEEKKISEDYKTEENATEKAKTEEDAK